LGAFAPHFGRSVTTVLPRGYPPSLSNVPLPRHPSLPSKAGEDLALLLWTALMLDLLALPPLLTLTQLYHDEIRRNGAKEERRRIE